MYRVLYGNVPRRTLVKLLRTVPSMVSIESFIVFIASKHLIFTSDP